MPISRGVIAPDFTLPDETGSLRRLSEFKGRPVVLYFYPKDDTPGCTTEACNFRDDYSAYVDADVVLVGVSPDNSASHSMFKTKYKLPFLLLSDQEHKVCGQYGVWGVKKYMGKEYEGVLRTTFLIDGNGRIVHVFENVKPDGHSTEVLAALKKV